MWKNQFYDAEEEETVRSVEALKREEQNDEDFETATSFEQVFFHSSLTEFIYRFLMLCT